MSGERSLRHLFALALAVLAANAVVSYWSIVDINDTSLRVARTHEVLAALQEVTNAVREAEWSGAAASAPRLARGVQSLRALTADDPDQRARLDRLGAALARLRGGEAGPAVGEIEGMRRAEKALLARRTDRARASVRRAAVTFTLVSSLALGLLGSAAVMVRRGVAARGVWEGSLKESERRVRLLLESTGEGIYGIDARGFCTFCNPAAAKILGYPDPSALLGREAHPLIHHTRPDGSPLPVTDCRIHKALLEGRHVNADDEVYWRADGSPVPIEYHASPVIRDGATVGAVITFSDISKRRRDEEAMRVRDRVLDGVAQGICITDPNRPDNPIVYVNPAFERITGYAAAEANGRNCRFLQGPGTDREAVARVRQALADRREVIEELLNYRKDGTPFWNELSISPVHDPSGRVGHFVAVQTDVTARRRDEETLRLRDRSLAAISQGLFITDPSRADEPIIDVNDAFTTLTGYAADEVKGRDFRLLFGPETDAGAAAALGSALRNRTECSVETRLSRKDGSAFWCLLEVSPVVGHAGFVTHFVGVMTDVTGRKEWQENLRRGEQRYRSLVEATAAIVWDTPAEGGFTHEQPGWGAFTGQSFDELKGDGWLRAVHPDDREAVAGSWADALRDRTPFAHAHRLRRRDGEYRDMVARAVPIFDRDGSVREWIGVHDDVTERVRAEEALLLAKEAAEAANRSKSTFLANMSHELRTPLNAIIGYSEMLQEEAEESGDSASVSDLRKIHAAGRHLLGLINDVLDLSKIEAGKMDLYLESFDGAAMVNAVADTVRPLVAKGGNELVVECAPALGVLRADLTKTRQALLNLLSNATKFTHGGTITLSATRDGETVVFAVRDTGIGMSAEEVDRLFRPFTQADPSTTRRYGGTGLGLTITRRFCQIMGGDVSVESAPGAGSTFTVRLPAVVADQAPEPDEYGVDDGPAGQSGDLVLVVDDDPAVREMMRRTLEKEGYLVREATGGADGLRLARELKPDAITLDVMMPGMDGWAVLTALKADAALSDIPVVIVTIVDAKNLGFALGASDYLTKPIDRKRLSSVLARYRHGKPAGSALVVDDDPDGRRMVVRMLEHEGWQVVEAENGRAALDCLESSLPDLVLLDLMMPEMDGFEFAYTVRHDPRWRDLAVLVLTAKDLDDDDRRRLNGRVMGVLRKGEFSREDLIGEIRRGLNSRRSHAPGTAATTGGLSTFPD